MRKFQKKIPRFEEYNEKKRIISLIKEGNLAKICFTEGFGKIQDLILNKRNVKIL